MQELELTNFVLRGTKIIVVDSKAREQLEELNIAMEDKLNTSVFVITVDELRNAINNKQDIIIGVTQSELESLSGVTGNIQTQIDSKQNVITGGISTGTNTDYTGNRVLVTNSNGKLAVSSITTTLLNYLADLTGNVQTQINNKMSTSAFTTAFTSVPGGASGNVPFLAYYWCVRGNTKHIEFNGQALVTKIPANTWTSVIQLPSEMKPTIQTYRTIEFGGTVNVIMQINTNGVVQFYCSQELVVGSTCYDGVDYL